MKVGLSVATYGDRAGSDSPRSRASAAACWRSSLLAGPEVAAPEGGAELRVVLAGAGQLDQAVHGAQALEGVLAVEEAAVDRPGAGRARRRSG